MANEKLRAALQQAGLTADDLAQIVEVDIRTVRRWLSGRTPYPRQRGKVARALDTTEHQLWPETVASAPPRSQPTDLLAGYPTASDLDAPDWKTLMHAATDRIELLGDTLTPTLATPGVAQLLATKATHGCDIRILVSDLRRHLAPLRDQPRIEIRVLEEPAHHTIHRYDAQLLLTLHLLGQDPGQAPLLHLRRAAPGGLFDRLTEHYNDVWEQHSQRLDPELDIDYDEDEDLESESEPRVAAAKQPAADLSEPAAPSPRRWPRRPT
jgi:transcriptional regulator with XRE-family HTH domain